MVIIMELFVEASILFFIATSTQRYSDGKNLCVDVLLVSSSVWLIRTVASFIVRLQVMG